MAQNTVILKQEEQQSIDVIKILLACLHRWYWFVISVVICMGVAFFHLKKQTPKYAITGSIMIRNDKGSGPMFQSEMMDLMGYSGYKSINDEMEILHSYGIMEQTVQALNLQTTYTKKQGLRWVGQYPTPDIAVNYPAGYVDTLAAGVSIDIQRKEEVYEIKVACRQLESEHHLTSLSEAVETCAGPITFIEIHPLEPGDKMHISTIPLSSATDSYRGQVACSSEGEKKGSNIITISCISDQPRRAVDVITKMVELYNLDAVIDKNIMATNTANFINDRLNIITLELDTVEKAVEYYMREQGLSTSVSDEVQLVLKNKADYQKRQAEYEIQINLLNYIEEYLQDPQNEHSLIPANLGVSDAALVGMMREYNELLLNRMRITRSAKEDNPSLRQADLELTHIRQGILTSIRNNREGLMISKNDVTRLDEQNNRIIRQVPAKEREYMEIKRQQEIKEKLFIYLYEKREENALTLASTVMPAKVVDRPRSTTSPVSPKKMRIYLIALMMGCFIPFGIIFLLDYFNLEIRNRKEFQAQVNAPFLGEIIISKENTPVVVSATANTVSAEMFRTIRTNMKFMLPDKPCPIVLVTSSLNGEGKSFIAVNTAISLALLGKKVVLVGLDIRKPKLAEYMNLSFKGALTSYLSDASVKVDELITPSDLVDGLDVVPTGAIPPNPAELIQSPRLHTLFDELSKRYDLVVVDTAPVSLVSDTFHLAPLADMTIYVTRANYTSREMLPFVQEIYDQKRLPNMACVLNGVDSQKSYGHYGYGHAYGYGHSYGYGNYAAYGHTPK